MSSKNRAIFVNNKSSRNISKKVIFGSEHYVIEGCGAIIGNSVMNDIHYPIDEVKKLASESTGFVHAPNSHPCDEVGSFISASSPEGVSKFYLGSFAYNWRMQNDRLVCDLAVNTDIASRSEDGKDLLARLERGESVDLSTGLIYKPVQNSGIGQCGTPFTSEASDMKLDHIAILLKEIGAATADQGVGIFANSADDKSDLDIVTVNASMPALKLDIVDVEWNEQDAIQRIREFTNSETIPSSNYRRYFLEFDREDTENFDAYKKLFADIVDGRPVAVKAAIEQYAKEELDGRAALAVKAYSTNAVADDVMKEPGSLAKLFTKFMAWFAINKDSEYNDITDQPNDSDITTNGEDCKMKEMLNAYLKDKGVNTDGMTDEEILNAYTEEKAKENKAKNESKEEEKGDTAANSALLAAVNALAAEVKDLKATQNSAQENELTALAAQVESLKIGLNAAQAKALGKDGMTALIEANGGVVSVNFSANAQARKTVDLLDDGTAALLAK